MRSTFLSAGALVALLVTGTSVEAQRRTSSIIVTRGAFSIEPFGGYLISQNFIDGPLDTRLGSVAAPIFGVQASLPLAPGASIIGSVGYSSGDLEVGAPIIGGVSIGDSDAWVLDASVELRMDSWEERGSRFVPFVQLGGGAIHRQVGVLGFTADATNFMVSAGVGADIPISNTMGIRLQARDHYGKADFGSLGPLDARTDDLHTFALSAGLRFAF